MSDLIVKIGTMLGGCAGLGMLEVFLTRRYAAGCPVLQVKPALGVPRLYGIVVLNTVASAFMLFYLGMKVGMSRKKYIEEAKNSGDQEAEARFSYPKMYAEGFSQQATEFNCVQRSHQQALETYPSFVVSSLIGGIHHPILASCGQVLWMVARLKWADGYSSGIPSRRYDSKWSFHIWTSFFLELSLASSAGVRLLFGA